jgi:formaldehyde-activating enzyme involved in methanogenesis
MYYDGKLDAHFHHSIRNEAWARAESGLYLRPPNHLNAVRREIASSIRFPELNVGEDRDYCLRLKEHLKTEAEIPKPIYRYNYSSYKSTTHG